MTIPRSSCEENLNKDLLTFNNNKKKSRETSADGTVYKIFDGLNCPHRKTLNHNYHPDSVSISMEEDSTWTPRMTGNLKPKSNSLSDLHNLQVTGNNLLQPRSGMWEVNRHRYRNEVRPEMVRFSLDSSYSLLRSDFGFKRQKTEPFEGILRQSQNVFYVETLEKKFRQVASRHLEALQTRGSRLPASEADCAIGRLRMVLGPARVEEGFGKRSENHLIPMKKEGPERRRDWKEKVFISEASGFKTNLQRQLTKKNFHSVPDSKSTKGNEILIVSGSNISKKKQL